MQTAPQPILLHTPLHQLHLELEAKMMGFAGYDMPVNYSLGVMKEHLHTRSAAGLFDVSHMGQAWLKAKDGSFETAAKALESLLPSDILGLRDGQGQYSLLMNERGGIDDDLIVTRLGDDLLIVVNAACKSEDFKKIRAQIGDVCVLEEITNRALLALQGPKASAALAVLYPGASELSFMTAGRMGDYIISRSGYTGEDGFEISVPQDQAIDVARRLLDHGLAQMIGLGARDSLRLEAGLCLYGHDLTADITPVEAGLTWVIGKQRRPGGERAGGFRGSKTVFDQMQNGPARKRVGIMPEGRAPAREGVRILQGEDRVIGEITSGGYSPSLERPIAMGYVEAEFAKPGTPVNLLVRGKQVLAHICKLPFVPHRFYRG